MKALIAAALAILMLAGCSTTPFAPTEADRYKQLCHDKGGMVSAKPEMWSVTYNCVGEAGNLLPEFVTA